MAPRGKVLYVLVPLCTSDGGVMAPRGNVFDVSSPYAVLVERLNCSVEELARLTVLPIAGRGGTYIGSMII